MAWNEPDDNRDKDPWGGGKKNQDGQNPPDLDEVIRKMQQRLSGLFGGGKKGPSGGKGGNTPSGLAGGGVLVFVLLGAWLAYDCTYIIQPAERGVVMRFGEYHDSLQPGPNFQLPRPFDHVIRVDVDQIQTIEVGIRSGSSTAVLSESLMLTKDENIIDIAFAVQYRIKDAANYLFKLRNPDETLMQATESAVREVIGKNTMDFALTEGRGEIASNIRSLIQDIVDRYESGLIVTTVNMQNAQPPQEVKGAFADAIKAREDQQRFINEAEAYSNDILPRARGAAERQREEAEAYKQQVIARAEGDAQRFLSVLREYEKAPEITRDRLYIESMESVLSNASKVMVDVEGGNNMLFLPLDRILERAKPQPVMQTPINVPTPEVVVQPPPRSRGERGRENLRVRDVTRIREER